MISEEEERDRERMSAEQLARAYWLACEIYEEKEKEAYEQISTEAVISR